MKAFVAVLLLAVIVIQMAKAKSLQSLEAGEAQDMAIELSELKHDVELLQQRLHDLVHEEDSENHVHKNVRREKEINKKSLGDIVNFLGKFLVG